jgi:membrane protein implicated in regulation of membrane protease activity
VAHSVSSASSSAPAVRAAGTEEPSVGTLVQSAMADVSTLVRSEIELAKAEVGRSAKKAGIGVGAFGAAGVVLAFSAFFFGIAFAEFLTWLGIERWISYLIVWFLLVLLAGIAALVGRRFIKRIEKPERTLETLHDLPGVLHREAPGERHRAVPEVVNGKAKRQGADSYTL